jgi:hypothetical protein
MSKEMVLLGFDTKSTAPYSKDFTARSASILPIAVSITTGTGVFAIMQHKAVNPSILGISTSMVTTSGLSFFVFSTASLPSLAVPTTRMFDAEFSISDTIRLISDESSTTSTFIISFLGDTGCKMQDTGLGFMTGFHSFDEVVDVNFNN